MHEIIRRSSIRALYVFALLAGVGCSSSDSPTGNERAGDASVDAGGAGASSSGGASGTGGANSTGGSGGQGGAIHTGGAGGVGGQSSGGRGPSGSGGTSATGGATPGDAGSQCRSSVDCPQTDCFGCPPIVCIDGKCVSGSIPVYTVVDLPTGAVRIAIVKKDAGRGVCFRMQLAQGGAPSSLHVTASPGWSVENAWSSTKPSDCDSPAPGVPVGGQPVTDASGSVTIAKDGTACLTSVNVVLSFTGGTDEPMNASFNGVPAGGCN